MRADRVGPAMPVGFGGARHPAMAFACPYCGAGVNAHCKRPSGHQGPMVALHAARRELAVQRLREIAEQQAASTRTTPPAARWAAAPAEPAQPQGSEPSPSQRLKWVL